MTITGEQIKQAYKRDPRQVNHALAEVLRDFGYPTLTMEAVAAITARLMADPPQPADEPSIIERFIAGWLKDGMD